MALGLSQEAIAVGADGVLSPIERSFLYMPCMRSESRLLHEWAEKLYRANGLADNHAFELKHKTSIDRFARGETVGIQPYDEKGEAKRHVKLDRPLDWAAISDHSEMLGEVRICDDPAHPEYDSDVCWNKRHAPFSASARS